MRSRSKPPSEPPAAEPAAELPEDGIVWRGASALRPFLVPIASLEPFPGNPRRGDVEAIRASLRRFGQTKALLLDGDTSRLVAGHHVTQAATAEGWTHVAAIPNEFANEEEARAYLLADNRTHDLGPGYDTELLYEHLKGLQAAGDNGLDGTGYTTDYVADLDAQMAKLRAEVMAPPEFPTLDPLTLVTEHRCPSCGYQWSGNPAPGGEPEPDDEDAGGEPEPGAE